VTKSEIVNSIAEAINKKGSVHVCMGTHQSDVKKIVQLTLDSIVEGLVSERRIELRNFGVFEVRARRSRIARNPKTGEKVHVPMKQIVAFSPGKVMAQQINPGRNNAIHRKPKP